MYVCIELVKKKSVIFMSCIRLLKFFIAGSVLHIFDVCYLQERMFVSITDLITLCSLLAISPAVREAAALLARGDKREITVLHVRNSLLLH
jgi:hypothetical protein